ncbi:MAG: hypothetical protein ABI685_12245 [Ferruginibacter sp.]
MRRLLFSFLLVCFYCVSNAQMIYPYQDIKLQKPSDYKETEPLALSAATFLLSTPFVEVDANRAGALTFLSNWMMGTKDYNFYMQGKVSEINTDGNLLSLFLAAMVKYSLENKADAGIPLKVESNAAKLVLAYCDDPKNNFKLKKKYRKLFENN